MTDFSGLQGAGLLGLALSGFLSATLLPGSSEVSLLLFIKHSGLDSVLPVLVVSVANTLGGFSTYGLGWWATRMLLQRNNYRAPSPRTVSLLQRWGIPALLFSWAPVVGDGMCLAAGWLRLHWLPCLLMMALGKTLRYVVLVYFFQGV